MLATAWFMSSLDPQRYGPIKLSQHFERLYLCKKVRRHIPRLFYRLELLVRQRYESSGASTVEGVGDVAECGIGPEEHLANQQFGILPQSSTPRLHRNVDEE